MAISPLTGNSNGHMRWLTWLAGLMIPTLFGGSIAWVSTTHRNAQAQAEDLAVLKSQMQDTRNELQRINNKLDRLLEKKVP
jgi:hypothetical protein